jgi:hypothetical protein
MDDLFVVDTQNVKSLEFDSFNITMVTDVDEDAIFYHIVAKDIAVTYLSLFQSVLRNAIPDFFDYHVVYNASELGIENFCISAKSLIKNHDDRICCHVFPNAINCRFMEALYLSTKEGRFGSKSKARRAKRVGNPTIICEKTIVDSNENGLHICNRTSNQPAPHNNTRP